MLPTISNDMEKGLKNIGSTPILFLASINKFNSYKNKKLI